MLSLTQMEERLNPNDRVDVAVLEHYKQRNGLSLVTPEAKPLYDKEPWIFVRDWYNSLQEIAELRYRNTHGTYIACSIPHTAIERIELRLKLFRYPERVVVRETIDRMVSQMHTIVSE